MRRIRNGLIGALVLAVGAGAAAHTYASSTAAPAQKVKKILTNTVNGQYAFTPKKATISVGTKVTWTNVSDAPHTVTSKGAWKYNKMLNQKASISYTFKKAGTYKYYCTYHPYMLGTIVVK